MVIIQTFNWVNKNQHFLFNSFHSRQPWAFVWKETKSTFWKKERFPSWELIFLLQKKVKKLRRNKILCQSILQFEFDDETNHFSCYKSKRISKAEQQSRKSSGTCCHDFFSETGRRKHPAKKRPFSAISPLPLPSC